MKVAEAPPQRSLRPAPRGGEDVVAVAGAGSGEGTGDRSSGGGSNPRARGALKPVAIWSRQLSVLLRSGTPLAQALQAIEKQTAEGAWRTVLSDVRERVEGGTPLSAALAAHPRHFDGVSENLIAAGESAGQLAAMLERLAAITRQQLKVRRALRGAMVYPALLLTVGVAVTAVMIVMVIPRFTQLFQTLDAPLPPTTQLLVGLSDILRSHWWAVLGGVAAIAVALRLAASSAGGRRLIDRGLVTVPLIGPLTRSLCTARVARLLGVLLESRVPLLQALRLTRRAAGNSLYATGGEPVSTVFARSALMSPTVAEAIHHGEHNGQMGPILSDMADFLDEENEAVVKTVMSVLEPLILIVLGSVVGFIAFSLFMPLFDLTSMTGGG
jgi:type II secretory pathway component PulF